MGNTFDRFGLPPARTAAGPPPENKFQPANDQPASGVAVKVTCVPVAKLALHAVRQLMPAGELVTVPLPVTLTERIGWT